MWETWVRSPLLGRAPGEGNGNPLQNSCLENPHGQRSLVGDGPWGCQELDTTVQLTLIIKIAPDQVWRKRTWSCICRDPGQWALPGVLSEELSPTTCILLHPWVGLEPAWAGQTPCHGWPTSGVRKFIPRGRWGVSSWEIPGLSSKIESGVGVHVSYMSRPMSTPRS